MQSPRGGRREERKGGNQGHRAIKATYTRKKGSSKEEKEKEGIKKRNRRVSPSIGTEKEEEGTT